MNTTFFKLAFRNILKNRLNSAINIIGFSVGIAASLFIFLFINYETSFDKDFPNSDRIYRLVKTLKAKDNLTTSAFTRFPVAPDIEKEIPGIEASCRVGHDNNFGNKVYSNNQLHVIENVRFTDENFFTFFNFKLKTGNPKTVLDDRYKIVLTEQTAQDIFGNTNVVGKTLLFHHKPFVISGIAANPPENTHLKFGAIASINYVAQNDEHWKGWGGGETYMSYLLLSKGVTPTQIEEALPALVYKKINRRWEEIGWSKSFTLQNISDVHISNGYIGYDCSSNRNKKSISIIGIISLLILLLAVINYIILYTAQKISRTKDVGILRIHGAGGYAIISQTYIEVFIVSTVSSFLGILLLSFSLPFLNNHLRTSVHISDNLLIIVGFLLGIILILSAIVTFFSTWRIVSLKAVQVLKNQVIIKKSRHTESNLLVTFQFSIVILLLISIFFISRQNKFLLNHELGFDKENILIIESEEYFPQNELDNFKQEVQQYASVHSVSLSSQTVGNWLTQNGYLVDGENEMSMFHVLYTDANFLNCFKINLLEGRNFSTDKNKDKDAILINKQLVKRTGWDSPLNKIIKRDGNLRVIGVTDDFNFSSLTNEIKPMLIMSNPDWDGWGYSTINIRFQTSDVQTLIHQFDKLCKEMFPGTPFKVSFLDDTLAKNYEAIKAQQKIISFFGLIGTFIAIIGLFGLTVFTTRKRIKEIGVRKVNGAKVAEILALLNKDFVKWVAIAFAFAAPLAYYAMHKWLENFAYKTTLSWWIFALAGLLALGIALLTVSWQSWKAATRNPVEALRYE